MFKVLMLLTAILLGGCSAVYDTAKPVYKAGKVIVKHIPMCEETREMLRGVDEIATSYDEVRTIIVETIEENEEGKLDANTSYHLAN
jgi:hypothetical protein